MQNTILVIGLMAAFLFFLVDNNMLPATLFAKKQILDRFESNKQMDKKLRGEFQEIVDLHQAWSFIAFSNSDVTYGEYIDLLNQKAAMEYADDELERLRSKRLNKRETADYLEKIKGQEDAIDALKADLMYQKQIFSHITLMAAS